MNDLQYLIDRQFGICSRYNYDNVLKRLVVNGAECFYGLQPSSVVPAASLDQQDPPIFACRFSEAAGYENILALANEDGKVAIQDTSKISFTGALESFQCHNNAVFDLAWAPRSLSFVTVSGDHTASLWDVAESTPKRVLVFSNHTRSVKTAVFRPNEPSVFATGARDGHILVWDVRCGQPAVVVKPDNCLMNCHSSFTPKTPGSHTKRPRLDNHRSISITGLVFQDDTTLISCGECDGNIKVWDLRKNYTIYKKEPLPKHSIPYCGSSTKNGYTNLIIDDARMRLYASCMDNVIYCFNISTYNSLPEQRYVGHENSTFYIKTSLSPDSMYLVSGSSDKNAYIWNVKYSEPVVKLVGHWAEVTCPAWCQKGDMKIVTCSDDARHKIWRIGKEFISDHERNMELKGHAEAVPRTDITSLPKWGTLDRTPSSLKRKLVTTPGSYSSKRMRSDSTSVRKTKRCLTDLMNASRETDDAEILVKRLKLDMVPEDDEPKLLPAGIKRHSDVLDNTSPVHLSFDSGQMSSQWNYIAPKAGTSFMTPTKNYEKKVCRKLSPKSPKTVTPPSMSSCSPVSISPTKLRILSFNTPTKNLPNFVLDGEAPHLRLMSPVKKKQDTTNWLTRIVREKKGKHGNPEVIEKDVVAPLSPKENIPVRRNSVTEKTPKTGKKSRTLLTYFSVANKNK
ncbi:protein lethal(2)denticleless [Leguminivora glycinivorella]|uniref:protein lethal(2)denticleless n=1 Tax=Leguminivora glycinivorella TaxID=1035111 RepID=UPI00200F5FDE|nr:protein lethal(2)denticleless [Leguminivora glycinivorella]